MSMDDVDGVVGIQRDGTRWAGMAGAVEINHGVCRRIISRRSGPFSQRDTVGCEHRLRPLSGNAHRRA